MIHLNCRTSYSFMRGFGDVKDWRERSEEIGAEFAVADYCSTWGHTLFAGHAGLGVQLPIVSVLNKSPAHSLGSIIAYDEEGLEALYSLVAKAGEQMYYRPRVTWEQIREYMEGHGTLIVDAITPVELAKWADAEFGVLGINGIKSFMWDAAQEYRAIIAPGAQYPSASDRKAFEAVRAAGRGHRVGELDGSDTHMLSRADMDVVLRNSGLPMEALWDETETISAQVQHVRVPEARLIKPEGLSSLSEMLQAGIKNRFPGGLPAPYQARLDRELEVIAEKEFEDYFRFVADVVSWAKERFLVGPGRGSSSGSLVCYLLGITDVDPLVHGTMFARFIDPGRADLPDIDVDFPDVHRDEVFAYLRKKYGEDRVAKLGTISRWHAASALNDVARVEDIDRDDQRKLKSLADDSKQSLAVTCEINEDARAILARNPAVALAFALEGKPRHSGVHAAGVVLANEPLLRHGTVDGKGVLSLDMDGAESVGLLKFDVLGLRTLAVIQDCMELAGLAPVDYYNILGEIDGDVVNEKVWKLFQDDRVTGIFQFDGYAVRELAKKVTVEKFSDLCALTSLARPGPLYSGQADTWCAARTGETEVEYLDRRLIDVTESTYGQIVYQEQAMELTRVLAGFDDVMINKFRKTMGKKLPEALAAMRADFVAGYVQRLEGDPLDQRGSIPDAERIFDMLEEYSGYAFNLSHAVAYSMITYVCAWLKAEYPMQFVCAQLRSHDDDKKTKALLRDLTAEGYKYVPFDIQKSEENWAIIDGVVYGGFTAVRGIGPRTAKTCLERRAADPVGWTDALTAAQRNRLLSPYNTPWHDLTRLGETYASLYRNPREAGVRNQPIYQIDEVPAKKGSYCFIGKLVKASRREKDQSGKNNWFINLYFEDDSGDCGCTINRFKAPSFSYLLEEDALEKDYLVRGDIINDDGRAWFFLSKIKELPL